MERQRKIRKVIVIAAIFWGVLLAVGGVINGNQAITTPDLADLKTKAIEEKMSPHSLNCWIKNKRSDFHILEFAAAKECSAEFIGVRNYQCVSPKALENSKWLRKSLQGDKQFVVFGDSTDKSLMAATTLMQYGHKARMLDVEEKVSVINEQPAVNYTVEPIVKPVLKTSVSQPIVVAPAVASNPAPVQEVEEEGC